MGARPPAPVLPPASPGDRVLPDSPPRWLELLIMLLPAPVLAGLLYLSRSLYTELGNFLGTVSR